MRGIWVHLFDRSLKTKENILAFLDTAAAANFNTVIVQAARRHDAFYDSDVLPRTTDDEMTDGLDMLGTLVPAAHERGLDVHVWYAVAPTMHATMVDEDLGPDHITNQHGFGTDDPWLQAGNDRSYAYMDPAIPGFQEHVAAMYRDVVERYDVDGIHLDYLRYECLQVADDGTCRYDAETGDGATANQHPVTMARYRDHGQGSLADFMRQQTEDLVRRIYLEVADVDPTVVVSGALIAQGDGPGAEPRRVLAGQGLLEQGPGLGHVDRRGHPRRGLPHGLLPRVRPPLVPGLRRLGRPSPRPWTADDHVVALGQAAYLNCVDQSLDQIRQSREATDGVVVYSYQGTIAEEGCSQQPPGDLLQQLRDGMFAEPAPAPEVPRKADPTQGHILVQATDGQQVTVTGPDGQERTRQADATGHAGFVWVDPGTWQVSVGDGPSQEVQVEVAEVSRVDLAG